MGVNHRSAASGKPMGYYKSLVSHPKESAYAGTIPQTYPVKPNFDISLE
jgi:hypothetical protein